MLTRFRLWTFRCWLQLTRKPTRVRLFMFEIFAPSIFHLHVPFAKDSVSSESNILSYSQLSSSFGVHQLNPPSIFFIIIITAYILLPEISSVSNPSDWDSRTKWKKATHIQFSIKKWWRSVFCVDRWMKHGIKHTFASLKKPRRDESWSILESIKATRIYKNPIDESNTETNEKKSTQVYEIIHFLLFVVRFVSLSSQSCLSYIHQTLQLFLSDEVLFLIFFSFFQIHK